MRGDERVLEALNEVLTNELMATNQYYLHYAMQKNWGFTRLAKTTYDESIDEMKHADRFADRILFLDGFPNFQSLNPLRIGETVEEILKADLEAEYEAVEMYRRSVAICEEQRDYASRDLFAEVLRDEEGHIDFLETQFEMIARMGLQNYVQLNSNAAESHG